MPHKHHHTFPHDKNIAEAPEDVVRARLDESYALLTLMFNDFDDAADEFNTPAAYLRSTIGGIRELIDAARNASNKMVQAVYDERRKHLQVIKN